MGMSIREYARHRGVSHEAVRKALRSGRIRQDAEDGIDPDQADADWEKNTRSSVVTTPPQPVQVATREATAASAQVGATDSPNTPSYQKARAVKEFYAARLAKLEYEEREGKLVNIDEINVQHFNRARRLRDRLLVIPHRLAARLAAETDVRTVEEMLDTALCEALEDLSGIRREN
jgi:hypothetical protein